MSLAKALTTSSERMKIRDMAAVRRENTQDGDLAVAGRPSATYGKPFAYIKSCVPGHKLDSARSNLQSASSRTRDFMLGLGGGSSRE